MTRTLIYCLLGVLTLGLAGCADTAKPLGESAAAAALTLEPVNETREELGAMNGRTAVLYRTDERARFALDGVPKGSYAVSVRARGDNYEGWPKMRLSVDGKRLGEDVAVERATYQEYTFSEVALSSGQVIEAVFTNDNYDGSAERDRNLYIDHLTLIPVADTEQDADQDTGWDTVYEGLDQSEPLELRGVSNVLIRNSTFTNVNNSSAILIKDAANVRVENVTIDGVGGENSHNGVYIVDSTEVSVVGNTISNITSRGQSAGIKIWGGKSANITLEGNHIYDAYGNGIVSDGCSSCLKQVVHDVPVPNLRIINNLIHDVGKTPTPVKGSPTHGMYLKAQDVWVEGNTVYNVFDGSGISIRSTARVLNNRIWDTRFSALWLSQMKPAGPSMRSVVRGNELFFTDRVPLGAEWSSLLILYWGKNEGRPFRYDTFEISDNTFSICTTAVGDFPHMRVYPFANLSVENNVFVDTRDNPRYFSNYADLDTPYEPGAGNSFNKVGCLSP